MTIKRVKFNSDEINGLFRMLNADEKIKQIRIARKGNMLMPIDVDKSFANPSKVKQQIKVGKRANATITIDAGHVYDDYGNDRVKTDAERTKVAVEKMNELIARINQLLSSSNDPLYSQLEAEAVNKEFDVVRTYVDPYDDGDDWYGLEVFISIHYKKGKQ